MAMDGEKAALEVQQCAIQNGCIPPPSDKPKEEGDCFK